MSALGAILTALAALIELLMQQFKKRETQAEEQEHKEAQDEKDKVVHDVHVDPESAWMQRFGQRFNPAGGRTGTDNAVEKPLPKSSNP